MRFVHVKMNVDENTVVKHGQPVYWKDEASFVVTATPVGVMAGTAVVDVDAKVPHRNWLLRLLGFRECGTGMRYFFIHAEGELDVAQWCKV